MESFSYISNAHPEYIEAQYNDFRKNPESIDPEWKKFFEGFDFAVRTFSENGEEISLSPKEFKVYNLIQSYRSKGHLLSFTNPIRPRKDRHPHLDLSSLGLDEKDLDEEFFAGSELGLGKTKLRNIIDHLRKIYCLSIGVEYDYLTDPEILNWFQKKIESQSGNFSFSIEKKKHILEKLNQAVGFENFLNKKYIGQKRFSLEGGETTIPALDAIINKSADSGVEEIVIGMAHRGRLNILATILGKTYEQIFNEFEGNITPDTTMGDGDVKYHLGFSSQVKTPAGKEVYLKLSPNPSHLEAVDPIVEGFVRAKADVVYKSDFDKILPILIHGDSSVAGQGVVYEVLQMSELKGYLTGGTLHFVINNQIGFTTDFDDARSSDYCTSLASMVEAPVMHVNGDDPEAVIFCVELATEFRQKFNRDIFVDMVCYRRHGHNEGDDPKYTQPGLYNLITTHANPREVYIQQLIAHGDIESAMAKDMEKKFWKDLQDRLDEVKQNHLPYKYQEPELAWKKLRVATTNDFDESPDTSIKKESVDLIVNALSKYPDGFQPLKKVEQMLSVRRKIYNEEGTLDWALGELVAYGSLLLEGHDVRLSGQDVKRGTFSHRHATIYDEKTNEEYNRLNHLAEKQGIFRIYNSLLSEFAVLGFEYGYSWATPESLVIWEAQFGDFSNGAQTIIDQFISSGESKWRRMSGIVLLLPHGYEGQGPEHSSARLERYLQLCAENNLAVVNCSTPANFFHVMRRQLYRPFRKPLVVMSPKSLLRHPRCISKVNDFTVGGFLEVIDDVMIPDARRVKRVLFCSGKIYYDLLEKQEKEKRTDVAIVRIEQLFPLPQKKLDAITQKYSQAHFVWVQEEPANMGAWSYLTTNYSSAKLHLIARKASASPATGFSKVHADEQHSIIEKAFEL
jgi:2-oxoglutarate dehydrogenase E1 component